MWAINFRTVSPDKNYDGHIFKLSDTNAIWTMLVLHYLHMYEKVQFCTNFRIPVSQKQTEMRIFICDDHILFSLTHSAHQSNINDLINGRPSRTCNFTIFGLFFSFFSHSCLNYTAASSTSENSHQRLASRFLHAYTFVCIFEAILFSTTVAISLFQYFYYKLLV